MIFGEFIKKTITLINYYYYVQSSLLILLKFLWLKSHNKIGQQPIGDNWNSYINKEIKNKENQTQAPNRKG